MKHLYSIATALLLVAGSHLSAQTGCPGCIISLPAGLATDTVYLPPLPDGQQNEPFDEDISFRLPKTTTPVAAIDSTTPPGLTITSIEILDIEGLPAGLSWQANQTLFQVATQTDGCIKVCGTPLQSGFFELTIRLEATIFFFSQETSFTRTLYIAPAGSSTDGFSMSGNIGCGSTTVDFTNNLPSNGQAGWTYTWDFGDGSTYSGENPPPHVYDTAGTYIVHYEAVIDTIGFVLVNVVLNELDCVDQLGLGTPDVYVQIIDTSGAIIYDSSPAINNINLPATFPVNLVLDQSNYTLNVIDEDGGLKGGDDICGLLNFNFLSNGQVAAGGFVGALSILNPKKTITSTDTVIVYPKPAPPVILAELDTIACSDSAPLPLAASYTENIQWWVDGMPIFGANTTPFLADESGSYTVQYTSAEGCTAVAAPINVVIKPLPALPLFTNVKNVLWIVDSLSIPMNNFSLQWYRDSMPITGETGYYLCTLEAGFYQVVITDLTTSCQNNFAQNTLFNPNFDCTVGTNAIIDPGSRWKLMPNPFSDHLTLQWNDSRDLPLAVRVFDATGRLVAEQANIVTGQQNLNWHTADWSAGFYTIQVITQAGSFSWKMVHE
jgi:PKD domain/Secretion system C-terminal sorting domain